MDKGQALIEIYRTCFYISAAVTVLGLASAVFLFFKFDIRTIFEIRSGRAARRTIQKMEQANAATGRLRQQEEMDYTTGGLSDSAQRNGAVVLLSTASLRKTPEPVFGETMPLPQQTPLPAPTVPQPAAPAVRPDFPFVVTQSLMLVHTDETI